MAAIDRTAPVAPRTPSVLGLLVPADATVPVRLILVRAAAAAIGDAIGDGLVDDDLTGAHDGRRFGVYLDAERQQKGMPHNDRAAVLMTRLGYSDRAQLDALRGNALVVGIDVRGGDCDVPAGVLAAACQAEQRVVVEADLDTGEPTR